MGPEARLSSAARRTCCFAMEALGGRVYMYAVIHRLMKMQRTSASHGRTRSSCDFGIWAHLSLYLRESARSFRPYAPCKAI